MIINQLAMCEACRNQTCKDCKAFKRRQARAKKKKKS